jgi:hypothetical protein
MHVHQMPAASGEAVSMNLTFLLPNGPHILTEPTECSGIIVNGKQTVEFGYVASSVVRKATAEEVSEWRRQG